MTVLADNPSRKLRPAARRAGTQPGQQYSGDFGPATVVAKASHSDYGLGLPGDGDPVRVFPTGTANCVPTGILNDYLA